MLSRRQLRRHDDGRANVYVGQTSWSRGSSSDRSLRSKQRRHRNECSRFRFGYQQVVLQQTFRVLRVTLDSWVADGGAAYMRLEDIGSSGKSYDLRVVDGSNDFEILTSPKQPHDSSSKETKCRDQRQ